ncbi:hypothetical protein K4K59_009555 [Colletotrichum sp. SAR11_240]|nr:hypothetical protein K4K59_009555 [Colletotrichum sp. SAR11_240]
MDECLYWARFDGIDTSDPYKYSEAIVKNERFKLIWGSRSSNLDTPFLGITTDGQKRNGLYKLQNEGAPIKQMVNAAHDFIRLLSPGEKEAAVRDLDSEEWRKWINPEIVIFKCGLRLEHIDKVKVDAIMEILKQSLSESGLAKVQGAMKTNKFLGEICGKEAILNEHSYFFTIFGEPSATAPWAFMLYGHHLALNVFIAGEQMAIGPVFIGAEPSIIDEGPDKGLTLSMSEDRWHPADQRHLAGAFHDNRIIPYEGVLVTEMTTEQQELLMSIVSEFLVLLPPEPLKHRLEHIRAYLSETYFAWIGHFGPADPFYYRIQSPVALFEFDHHSGVFLTNEEPAKYHIHTIQRLPNGNDYGRELRELCRKQGHNGKL